MPAVTRGAQGGRGAGGAGPRGSAPTGRAAGPRRAAAASAPAGSGRLRAGLDPRVAPAVAGLVLVLGAGAALGTGGRLHALGAAAGAAVARGLGSAGLRLATVRLEGVSPYAQADVLRAAGLSRDMPLAGLDLAALRERVEQVGWIKSARIVRLYPDTVVIAAAERPRLAVWQMGGRPRLIDTDGQVIPEADAGRFTDLPLVVGEGANEAAAAVLPLVQARPRLMERLEALVRVDARRWDLRLKDGGIVQLPAQNEDAALIQLDQLDQRSRLLELGFARIDLRDPEMVTVRPRGADAAPAPGAAPTGL